MAKSRRSAGVGRLDMPIAAYCRESEFKLTHYRTGCGWRAGVVGRWFLGGLGRFDRRYRCCKWLAGCDLRPRGQGRMARRAPTFCKKVSRLQAGEGEKRESGVGNWE